MLSSCKHRRQISTDNSSEDASKRAPHETQVYTAGFPCTPFSYLHSNSSMLADKNARQFYQVVEDIKESNPSVFMLENVMGILRVWGKIMENLATVGSYLIWHGVLDPLQFGCPVSRRRVYVVGIRRDMLPNKNDSELIGLAEQIKKATHSE